MCIPPQSIIFPLSHCPCSVTRQQCITLASAMPHSDPSIIMGETKPGRLAARRCLIRMGPRPCVGHAVQITLDGYAWSGWIFGRYDVLVFLQQFLWMVSTDPISVWGEYANHVMEWFLELTHYAHYAPLSSYAKSYTVDKMFLFLFSIYSKLSTRNINNLRFWLLMCTQVRFCVQLRTCIMASWNGKVFRVLPDLCKEESTWPVTRSVDVFLLSKRLKK